MVKYNLKYTSKNNDGEDNHAFSLTQVGKTQPIVCTELAIEANKRGLKKFQNAAKKIKTKCHVVDSFKEAAKSGESKQLTLSLYDVFRIVRNILGVYISVYLLGTVNEYIT